MQTLAISCETVGNWAWQRHKSLARAKSRQQQQAEPCMSCKTRIRLQYQAAAGRSLLSDTRALTFRPLSGSRNKVLSCIPCKQYLIFTATTTTTTRRVATAAGTDNILACPPPGCAAQVEAPK